MAPPNTLDTYVCKACDTRYASRENYAHHKGTLMHEINVIKHEMNARGWVPVRTPRPTLRLARIPHAYRRISVGAPNTPNFAPDHPSNFRNFIPKVVAEAITDWGTWNANAKKKTTLKDYLKAMFGTVYTDAELNAVPVTLTPEKDPRDDEE